MNQTQRNPRHQDSGTTIMRDLIVAVLTLAIGGLTIAGCAEPGPDLDRTQANLVDKSIFEHQWW
ncbi:MAG TPA: hypothetical protein ENK57_12970, partial [Polyangiaceae bacterium]|nr:hypothetical protein [Polyangiaceae bacterium]